MISAMVINDLFITYPESVIESMYWKKKKVAAWHSDEAKDTHGFRIVNDGLISSSLPLSQLLTRIKLGSTSSTTSWAEKVVHALGSRFSLVVGKMRIGILLFLDPRILVNVGQTSWWRGRNRKSRRRTTHHLTKSQPPPPPKEEIRES
jgi:hypothetical protein